MPDSSRDLSTSLQPQMQEQQQNNANNNERQLMMDPTEVMSASGPGASSPVAFGTSTSGVLEIAVSDPFKQGEGMNAYVSYKVNTRTNLPQFEHGQLAVVRRYSDFVWLRAQMMKVYPGIIVPPLPEKLMVGRFSEDFVEGRRRALERFLMRVSIHHILRDCEHFKLFLEQSEQSFSNMKRASKSQSKAASSIMKGPSKKGFWDMLSNASHTIQNKIGAGKRRDKTDQDVVFDEVANYVSGLEQQLSGAYKSTQSMVSNHRDSASCLYEFGLAFTLLGSTENNSNLGGALAELGRTADAVSALSNEQADKEGLMLEDPLRDYVRIVGSVRVALHERAKRVEKYEVALADLEIKKATVQRLVSHDSRSVGKVATAQQQVNNAETQLQKAKEMMDLVTERVLAESDRFKREKMVDLKRIIVDYVQVQIDYNKKVLNSWEELLPNIQAMQVEGIPQTNGNQTEDERSHVVTI